MYTGLLVDERAKRLFKKEIELNIIDRYTLYAIAKKELAAKYPVIKILSLKYIDYVCIIGNTAWIMEGKKKLNFEAIGQVNVLSHLFSKDYPQFYVRKAIVCEEKDPLIEDYCKEFDIEIFLF